MNLTYEICQARADEAAATASETKLVNVREQALRAEATWRAMANQQRAVKEARTLREAIRSTPPGPVEQPG